MTASGKFISVTRRKFLCEASLTEELLSFLMDLNYKVRCTTDTHDSLLFFYFIPKNKENLILNQGDAQPVRIFH